MADFCKQCGIATFGKDFGDLASIAKDALHMVSVICEGCGFIHVNHLGECISDDCLEAKSGRPHHMESVDRNK